MINSPGTFYTLLKSKFGFQTTDVQDVALTQLSQFILESRPNELYVLTGYAGTGKTSIIGTLVSCLWEVKKSAVLLAPTGRAAKVISAYARQEAFTIHKKIYFPKKDKGGGVKFVLQPNKHRNTIFIVDEASMIPDRPTDQKGPSYNSLLDDLIQYVYSGYGCRLILIGDKAQLPPIKLDLSPALNPSLLELGYQKEVTSIEMTQVVRQTEDSGILLNATAIREALRDELYNSFQFHISNQLDIVRLIDGYEIMDAINDAYTRNGHEETAIIVRSNKRANLYNKQIRDRILFRETKLAAGDYLMVVKNNYFWIKPSSEAGFIANGDIIEVLEIFAFKELYGFQFAEVKVKMVDYPKMRPFETVLLLDTIDAETPSLSYEESNKLYQKVAEDYAEVSSNYKRFLSIKNNKYFNALQVKFSYAITCHKSQGGQWSTIFVEQPYLPDGMNRDYLRWLYTAVTRAKDKLYLIGFNDQMFTE
jgi:ATP-dependent exoDNAse (exonuclease V) alpha subunit